MSHKIHSREFRVKPGHKVDLDKWPTKVDPYFDSKQDYEEILEHIKDLESHLHRNGTQIVKFFLHLSKHERERRFM